MQARTWSRATSLQGTNRLATAQQQSRACACGTPAEQVALEAHYFPGGPCVQTKGKLWPDV